jgi:hypothetical protein
MGDRLWVAVIVERFDGDHIPFDGKGAQQQLGKAAGLLGFRIGPAPLGHVAGHAGQRLSGGIHDLVDSGRWSKKPGQVAYGELDSVQNVGQWRKLAQLRQAPERLHPADHIVEWLPVRR